MPTNQPRPRKFDGKTQASLLLCAEVSLPPEAQARTGPQAGSCSNASTASSK